MKVEVSNGELLDKLAVLEIKAKKKLPVSRELETIKSSAAHLLKDSAVQKLYRILLAINSELWIIEDTKRQCERDGNFGEEFVKHARLVYMVNDERAKIKKYIDRMSGSTITEEKSHDKY